MMGVATEQDQEAPAAGAAEDEGIMIIKKYSNRRLYDTGASRYITLEELTEKIRAGEDVRVVDAKTGDDITQATLAQVIVENRGAAKLLPVPLLTQLIRMGDDALGEFFSQYMSWFFELYVQLKQGMQSQAASPFNPFSMFSMGANPFAAFSGMPAQEPPAPQTEAGNNHDDEIAELKREMEALKKEILKSPDKAE